MNVRLSIFAVGYIGNFVLPCFKIGSFIYVTKSNLDRALLENGVHSKADLKLCGGQDAYKVEVWHQKTKVQTLWT